MAIVTATITVDFTANYSGDHRVCWRVMGSGDPYDCSTIVNCAGGATACQAIFTADVNTTSCDGEVFFEGYIQAICEDILSTQGRLPFTTSFVPNPTCLRHEVLCLFGEVEAVQILDPGINYDIGDTVVITRDGADTQVADATLTISGVGDGVINTITGLLSGGLGYIATEVLTINGAAGAGGTITIDSILPGGIIDTFTLTTNGAGYIGPFSFTGGSGAGADFDIVNGVDYDDFGSILGFNIVVPGAYEIPPVITITSATGQDFDARVLLEPCPAYDNIGTDCIGGDMVQIAPGALEVGAIWATCLATGPLAGPNEYEVIQIGCCIPEDTDIEPNDTCVDYHFDNATGIQQVVHVTDCNGDDHALVVPDGVSIDRCCVNGGVIDPGLPGLTITNTGAPCT
jgi:hypothetical protein